MNDDMTSPVEQRVSTASKTRHGTPQDDAMYQGIQRIFCTPKNRKDLSPDYEGLVDLFSSPILSANVVLKRVKFVSPVAVSAKRSQRSKTAALPTMVLNVPKLDSLEGVENVRQTRSQGAVTLAAENLLI